MASSPSSATTLSAGSHATIRLSKTKANAIQRTGPGADIPALTTGMRSVAPRRPRPTSVWVTAPLNMPMPTAASSFTTANSRPSVAAVNANMFGSISGELSQKAITGASGTSAASRPAITGMTPQEQNGDSAPITAASMIMRVGLPVNALATSPSSPLALAKAAQPTEMASHGAIPMRALPVKAREGSSCEGASTASSASTSAMAASGPSIRVVTPWASRRSGPAAGRGRAQPHAGAVSSWAWDCILICLVL